MMNASRLLEMARKWKRMAVLGRKRISWISKNSSNEAATFGKTIADKGHFIVYTNEGKRFMVPLTFLSNTILEELLKISEEEFGLPKDGPITLPCDAAYFEFVLSMLRKRCSKDIDNTLLSSAFRNHCSRSLVQDIEKFQQLQVF